MRVLVVGAASWDLVLHLDELPDPRPQTLVATRSSEGVGSTGAGKALNLARLGHEVHLHTVLGDDEAGARVRAALTEGGVVLHVDEDEDRTEQHVNLMGPDGDRVSVFRSVTRASPDLDLGPVVELAADCDAVVLNITDYVRRLVPELSRRSIPFWTDLHDWDGANRYHHDFLAADRIVFSDERLGAEAEAVGVRLAAHRSLVVCTRGSRGATAWTRTARIDVPVRPVAEVVDTNGAGDAFTAGLLHGVHLGWPLPRALAAAAVAGSTCVQTSGLASPLLSAALLDAESVRAL